MKYNYEALTVMPPHMEAWNNYIVQPLAPSPFGEYVLINAQPASIELHHQVLVVDEYGEPLSGIRVNFTYPEGNGPSINIRLTKDLWRDRPRIMTGNSVLTDHNGFAQHTIGDGGETIFVFDVNDKGELLLPSPIVYNNNRINVGAGGQFEHTGVYLMFQRRRFDVEPRGDSDTKRLREALLFLARLIDHNLVSTRTEENVLSILDG